MRATRAECVGAREREGQRDVLFHVFFADREVSSGVRRGSAGRASRHPAYTITLVRAGLFPLPLLARKWASAECMVFPAAASPPSARCDPSPAAGPDT